MRRRSTIARFVVLAAIWAANHKGAASTMAEPPLILPEEIVIGRNLQAGVMLHLGELPRTQVWGRSGSRWVGSSRSWGDSNPVRVVVRSQSPVLKLALHAVDAGVSTITVTVPPHNKTASFFIQAFADTGTAAYSAEAEGFVPATGLVRFAPSGIVLTGPASVSMESGGQTILLRTVVLDPNSNNEPVCAQLFAGEKPLAVLVRNGNPSVGSLPPVGIIEVGSDAGVLEFVPLAPGFTPISVVQPPGWTSPPELTSLDITVRQGGEAP